MQDSEALVTLFDASAFDEVVPGAQIAPAELNADRLSQTPTHIPGVGVGWERRIAECRMALAQLHLKYGPSDAERIAALQKAADAKRASEALRHENLGSLARRLDIS